MELQLVLVAIHGGAQTMQAETELIAYASEEGHAEVADFLLKAGVDKDAQDADGATALMVASSQGHVEIVRLLLEAGADHEVRAPFDSALLRASSNGHTEIVRLLLEPGQTVGSLASSFASACRRGHAAIARLLLEHLAVESEDEKDECCNEALMDQAEEGPSRTS